MSPVCSKTPAIIGALTDPSASARRLAITKLSWYGELCSFLPLLEVGLHDPDFDIRARAIGISGKIAAVNVDQPGLAKYALEVYATMLKQPTLAVREATIVQDAAQAAINRILLALKALELRDSGTSIGRVVWWLNKYRRAVTVTAVVVVVAGSAYAFTKVAR